jgi:hypothetical protein
MPRANGDGTIASIVRIGTYIDCRIPLNNATETPNGAHCNIAFSARRRRRATVCGEVAGRVTRRLTRRVPSRARGDGKPRRAFVGRGSDRAVDGRRQPGQMASRERHLRSSSNSCWCRTTPPAKSSKNSFRSCSTPITSPPARATRARNAD